MSVTAPRSLLQPTDLGGPEEADRSGRKTSRLPVEAPVGGGLGFFLVMVYMFLDVVRPPFVGHVPKVLTILILFAWLAASSKKVPFQIVCMLFFVAEMFFDVPFSANMNKAFWCSYGLGVLVVSLCMPFIQFVNTQARFQKAIWVLYGTYIVVAAWAATHKGFGPGGADAAQDENYVATWMAMAIPIAAYGSFTSSGLMQKLRFLWPVPIFLLAVVFAENASRGGFIGILCGLAYVVWYSKKRMMALVGVGLAVVFVVVIAGAAFWTEIGSIGETDSGTADHRKTLWTYAFRMYLGNPITGVGPANFRWRIGDYETSEDIVKHGRSYSGSAVTHSLYFELLSDLGTVGLVLFLMIVVRCFRDMRDVRQAVERVAARYRAGPMLQAGARQLTDQQLDWIKFWAHGLTASLIACLVCSAFLSTLYLTYFWLQATLIASFKLIADQMLLAESPVPVLDDDLSAGRRSSRIRL